MSIETATREFIKSKSTISKSEISNFLMNIFPGISRENMNWRIHRLLKTSVLASTGRGLYTSASRKASVVEITDKMRLISDSLKLNFPELGYSIWDTMIINDLSIHQIARYSVILEVERGTEDSVFYFMKDEFEDVFLSPSVRECELYVNGSRYPVIIKPMITQSPVVDRSGVSIPKPEKILVDIFVDTALFPAFHGNELVTIFKNATEFYKINFNTLLRYAGRRGARKRLENFLDICAIKLPQKSSNRGRNDF